MSFVANKEGKSLGYKFQKLHYPLEEDYDQENGGFSIFAFPLATVISFAIQLHVIFYTFGNQPDRLVCVCILM